MSTSQTVSESLEKGSIYSGADLIDRVKRYNADIRLVKSVSSIRITMDNPDIFPRKNGLYLCFQIVQLQSGHVINVVKPF